MNKNLKKIIALIFAVSVFSSIIPTTNLNLMTTKAYADEKDGITSLKIKNSSGSSINIYNDSDYDSDHEINNSKLEQGTYYAKTASDNVEISVSGVDSDYVRVFKGTSSDSTKGERVGSGIDLLSDTTTIIVRVYSTNPGSVKYGDSSYISQYRFKVKYTGSDEDKINDNVYLKSISLSSGDITFSKKTYSYNVNVDEEINKIEIGARPDCDSDEYDKYKVKINGVKVDDEDSYKEKVSLNEGKNEIEIKVEDDDDNERIYTLNITRGEATNSTNNSTDNNSSKNESGDNIENTKTMQWIKVNDKWKFNDSKGNIVKNSWIQNYYVQGDGNRAIGWLAINGSWYYFGADGAKKIGWQLVNGVWYYLDADGKMQTGWFKDLKDGKWYYLNSNGSLA